MSVEKDSNLSGIKSKNTAVLYVGMWISELQNIFVHSDDSGLLCDGQYWFWLLLQVTSTLSFVM